MCGIAGIMMREGLPAKRETLNSLAAALAHRGPDGTGLFLENHIGLLNTRLAIIDIAHGQQPFTNEDGAVLVANGEIYNDPSLREELKKVRFSTGSDCETPLHLFATRGIGFAEDLRGMYGLALYDRAEDRLILCRDPYGIKQLYFVSTPDYFAFASEAQALISAGLASSTLIPRVQAELLQLQFSTGKDTIYADIKRVLPGQTLIIKDGQITESSRIRPNSRKPVSTTGDDYESLYQQLDKQLQETVRLHIRSDAPSGLFLSGGIDSSALLTLMSRQSEQPVVALTAAFPEFGAKDESDKARAVAKAVATEHILVNISAEDFFRSAPQIASALDDPTADASSVPIFLLAEAARARGLKVVLSGEGADELFGGYKRYRRATWFFGLWRQKTRTRGVFSNLEAPASLKGWRDGLAEAELAESVPGLSAIQTLQAIDCAEWLPNDLLVKLDRCLMAHGVEGRTPFLDPKLSPFGFYLPQDFKVKKGLGKWMLRDWVSRNTPGADPWSKKQGFIPPIGIWIGQYKSRIEPLLRDHPAIAELSLQSVVRHVYTDPAKYPQAAWSLLFYALWYSRHVLGMTTDGQVDDVLDSARLAA